MESSCVAYYGHELGFRRNFKTALFSPSIALNTGGLRGALIFLSTKVNFCGHFRYFSGNIAQAGKGCRRVMECLIYALGRML